MRGHGGPFYFLRQLRVGKEEKVLVGVRGSSAMGLNRNVRDNGLGKKKVKKWRRKTV